MKITNQLPGILILFLFLFFTPHANAQSCYRDIFSFQMATGGYDIYGMATIIQDTNGQLVVTFNDDFNTGGGPDLHVFLSKTFAAPNDDNPDKIEIGALQSTSGAQSYLVPSGVAIDDYDWLLIHCVTYNHFWGGGEFGIVEGNCIATGTGDPADHDLVKLFSSNGTLFVQNIPDNTVSISVYNLSGQPIFLRSITNGGSFSSNITLDLKSVQEIIIVRISTAEKEMTYQLLAN